MLLEKFNEQSDRTFTFKQNGTAIAISNQRQKLLRISFIDDSFSPRGYSEYYSQADERGKQQPKRGTKEEIRPPRMKELKN